jgi:hypothetical protein
VYVHHHADWPPKVLQEYLEMEEMLESGTFASPGPALVKYIHPKR